MLVNERENRAERVLATANAMATAARTAPKGKGIDIIEIAIATGDTIKSISDMMLQLSEETGMHFLIRDAENILQGDALLLIGTRQQVQGLNCAYCGFSTCEGKPGAVPCAINTTDVGIAIGSACAMAADLRVDTRVMFSVGLVARRMELLPSCETLYGIAISCSSKNPFFDRKSTKPQ